MIPKTPGAKAESRKVGRSRVLIGGKILLENLGMSMDCRMRDLTDEGARIVLAPGILTPDHFELINLRDGVFYSCAVIWRDPPQLGVKFETRHELTGATDPRLVRIRALWMNIVNR